MYDIRQFKPTLYIILIIGFTGFCMAAEFPALWVFGTLGWALNAWLVYTDRFTPLPRWMANVATILALLYIVSRIAAEAGPPLMFIGQFLLLLQLIKLYEQRANRDYAQLLVLSILLMVAAAINTASLLFGVLLALYLVLVLYCCLIFHLKVEADRAKTAFPIPADQINPKTLQLDQRFLPRSMRRLTALVSVAAVTMGIFVFLFFPRGAGQGVLGQLQFRPPQSLTGFNDKVNFEQIARITQNQEVVAHVQVWRDGSLVEGTEPLLLRGLTLDTYNTDPARTTRSAWTRSYRMNIDNDYREEIPPAGELRPSTAAAYRQRISLRPTGTRYLFALQGLMWRAIERERVVALHTHRNVSVRYSPQDEALQTEAINVGLEYEVYSTNTPRKPDTFSGVWNQITMTMPPSDPRVLDQVRQYALRPDVLGDLAGRKGTTLVDPVNKEIAAALERHLQATFTYTLDLTEEKDKFRDLDPVVAFLTQVKKGHCEYFASAMTLMCQSLNIPARMVVGFKCDEYNPIGSHYTVRQAHAHTWVEVLTPEGWTAYDPTSGREAFFQRKTGFLQSVRHFFDYLEYKWAENVVAYDARNRDNLIKDLDGAATNLAIGGTSYFKELREWFGTANFWTGFWTASFSVIRVLMILMVVGMLVAIALFMYGQYRLKQRAQRIGLDSLPLDEQLRLARQLAFYDDFTTALHRHRIVRPTHQTPMEFSNSLVFLPTHLFDTARRLTQLFYRIRFGDADLTPSRQRHLEKAVGRFVESLDDFRASPADR